MQNTKYKPAEIFAPHISYTKQEAKSKINSSTHNLIPLIEEKKNRNEMKAYNSFSEETKAFDHSTQLNKSMKIEELHKTEASKNNLVIKQDSNKVQRRLQESTKLTSMIRAKVVFKHNATANSLAFNKLRVSLCRKLIDFWQ